MTALQQIPLSTITGDDTSLADHAGSVLLIVNVASKCGLTPQYDALEALHAERRDDGFSVLGFPANDFGAQEPGTNEEIAEFCQSTFAVDFPLFAKISVVGEEQHPLYKELTTAVPRAEGDPDAFRDRLRGFGMTPNEDPDILWNFEKFLVARDGSVVRRFAPTMAPDDPAILAAIDEELARDMERRHIGSLEVSIVGLGCNNFGGRLGPDESTAVIHAALDAGINFLDTADVYGGGGRSESFIGAALAGRRDEVVIGTKFGAPFDGEPSGSGAGASWIREAVEGSLRRLGTDHIDLYQQHVVDPAVPIEETQEVLDELVRSGKVREIGSSNVTAAQIDAADDLSATKGWARFESVQNRFNLLDREALDDAIPACERHGVAFLPFFPLASGMLTGKYAAGEPFPAGTRLSTMPADRAERFASDRNFEVVAALAQLAAERDHTLLELAFAWLAAQPTIASVIAGATTAAQITANVAAVDWTLTPDDLAAVEEALA